MKVEDEQSAFVEGLNDHVKTTTMEALVKAQSLAAKHDGIDTEAEYRLLNVDQKNCGKSIQCST